MINMKYLQIIHFLDCGTNQTLKCRTKIHLDINDYRKTVNWDIADQIKFKINMIGSNLWDYSDPCILCKRTIIITEVGTDEAARQADETSKQVIFIS